MNEKKFTQTLTVSTISRPKRIAFLVDPSDTTNEELNEIVRYYTSIWGGRFNIIIPATEKGILPNWWALLKNIDPDIICTLVDLDDDLRFKITRFILPADLIVNSKEDRLRRGLVINGGDYCALGVEDVMKRVWAYSNPFFDHEFLLFKNALQEDDEQNFLVRNFGIYRRNDFLTPLHGELKYKEHNLKDMTLSQLLNKIVLSAKTAYLPIDYSSELVNGRPVFDSSYYDNVCIIVVGDSVWDAAYYWNLMSISQDALKHRHMWVPTSLIENDSLLGLLAQWIESSNERTISFSLTSFSLDEKALASLASDLGLKASLNIEYRSQKPEEVKWPNRKKVPEKSKRHTEIVALSGNKGMVGFPRPSFLDGNSEYEGWMVDMDIQYRPERGAFYSNVIPFWRLPKRPWLSNEFFGRCTINSRITDEGRVSRAVKAHERTIVFHVPSDFDIIETYVDKNCRMTNVSWSKSSQMPRFTSLKTSDEGSYLQSMIKLFGNISEAGHCFEDPFWRDTFLFFVGKSKYEEFIEGESKKKECIRVSELKNRFKPVRNQAIKARHNVAWWEEHKTFNSKKEELQGLFDAKVFLQGANLRCPYCKSEQWLFVDDIKSDLKCNGCMSCFKLEVAPEWYCKLNSFVYNTLGKKGTLAVIQTLYKLKFNSNMFLYLPSQDIFEDGSNNRYTDIDIVAIRDGKFIVGEVKSKAEDFKVNDFSKLSQVAKELLPNEVLLAAPGNEWPASVMKKVEKFGKDMAKHEIKVVRMHLEG